MNLKKSTAKLLKRLAYKIDGRTHEPPYVILRVRNRETIRLEGFTFANTSGMDVRVIIKRWRRRSWDL